MSRDVRAVTWVLEEVVFPETHEAFRAAVLACGHAARSWNDVWWSNGGWPRLSDPTVFHGSLGNADQIRRQLPWLPGAYCSTDAFCCSAWYPMASQWLLHRQWRVAPAMALVESPHSILAGIGNPAQVFVRPDSPLKPFSGRILPSTGITLKALDHGFYFDDPHLPVVVAPVRQVEDEWRYVVVAGKVVAGSGYSGDRKAMQSEVDGTAQWLFAAEIAGSLVAPEDVYVMDVCRADGALWLLELNPFSGADLYGCDPVAVVKAVSQFASQGRDEA